MSDERDAELARLRAEVDDLTDSNGRKADRIDRLGETVERLRAELSTAQATIAKLRGALAEIERRLRTDTAWLLQCVSDHGCGEARRQWKSSVYASAVHAQMALAAAPQPMPELAKSVEVGPFNLYTSPLPEPAQPQADDELWIIERVNAATGEVVDQVDRKWLVKQHAEQLAAEWDTHPPRRYKHRVVRYVRAGSIADAPTQSLFAEPGTVLLNALWGHAPAQADELAELRARLAAAEQAARERGEALRFVLDTAPSATIISTDSRWVRAAKAVQAWTKAGMRHGELPVLPEWAKEPKP